MEIPDLLAFARSQHASDLHLSAGLPPLLRVHGDIRPIALPALSAAEVLEIRYPIEAYPAKITSFNLDKQPLAEGTLLGIKGQYLMFDTGVINIRKYTAYQLAVHEIAA